MTNTQLMQIPGHIDPLPVARDITPREDGRVDLIGLPNRRLEPSGNIGELSGCATSSWPNT